MGKQLSFEFKILSSGKQQHSSLKKHFSSKKEKKPKQEKQFINELLPREEKELKLKSLSLEGVKTEDTLKETPPYVHSPKGEKFFENLIAVEELAAIFGLAPQTIRNWVAQGKLPYVKIGRRNLFFKRSMQEWLNRKEKPQWQ